MQLVFRILSTEDKNKLVDILRKNGYEAKSEHSVIVSAPEPILEGLEGKKKKMNPLSCPCCSGKGGFPDFSFSPGGLAPAEIPCEVCLGKGILWREEDKK